MPGDDITQKVRALLAGESFEIDRSEFRSSIADPIDRAAYLGVARRLAGLSNCRLEITEDRLIFIRPSGAR